MISINDYLWMYVLFNSLRCFAVLVGQGRGSLFMDCVNGLLV